MTANEMPDDSRRLTRAEAEQLLEELNYWVRAGGDPEHRPPSMKSTGEANAAVVRIKRQLEARNVRYTWDGTRYVPERAEK